MGAVVSDLVLAGSETCVANDTTLLYGRCTPRGLHAFQTELPYLLGPTNHHVTDIAQTAVISMAVMS